MKYFFSFLLANIAFSISSAQSNLEDGYIIMNSGDTVIGRIEYRNWKMNPSSINFVSGNNQSQSFDATSIKEFHINKAKDTYRSFTVSVDKLPGVSEKAVEYNYKDSSEVTRTVFLLLLVNHPQLCFYQYYERGKEHYYYSKSNENPIELIHNYTFDDEAIQVRENAHFRDQIATIAASCKDLASIVYRLKYTRSDLQKFLVKYLKCTSPNTVVDEQKVEKIPAVFGVVFGGMYNDFYFLGRDIEIVSDKYSSNFSPVIGVSVDFGLARNHNRLHIVNELIYKEYKTAAVFSANYGNGYRYDYDTRFKFSYLQVNSLVRYLFSKNSAVKPYLNLGIGNAFMLVEQENKRIAFDSFSGTTTILDPFYSLKKYEFILMGGTGIATKKLSLELRYSNCGYSFIHLTSSSVRVRSFQLIGTYRF